MKKLLLMPIIILFISCQSKAQDYDDNGFGNVDKYKYKKDLNKYQEAKERVLFKGFEYDDKYKILHYDNGKSITIEYLLSLNMEQLVYFDLVLTESAKKQIGL